MKRAMRLISTLCIISILATLFIGCAKEAPKTGTDSTQQAAADNKDKTDKKDAAPKNVTMRFSWWGGDSRHKATLAAIEAYTKKNPHVKIEAEYGGFDGYFQKLTTQLAGGTAPDIMQVDQPWLPSLTSQGDLFVDINTLKEIDLSAFDKKFLDSQLTIGGKLQGLPTGLIGITMFYNKTAFEKFGISADTQWTFDNLIEIGKQVHEKDKNIYLLNLDINKYDWIMKAIVKEKTGEQWVKDDYTLGFDKAILVEGLTWIKKAVDSGAVQPFEEMILYDKKAETNPKWVNGELLMNINWPSSFERFTESVANKDAKWDVTAFPISKDAKKSGVITRAAQVMCINKNSANISEAAKFINWMFNDDEAILILEDVRGVPATEKARKMLTDSKKLDERIVRATEVAIKNSGDPENGPTNDPELLEIDRDIIQKVGYGQLTPEKAADELIQRYTEKLAELKAKK
ncbi:ABC transporter substrate-binding protein [Petroclostridium xylanilyticum]|uniref:ABC transporter substrate-binding protein n=1 Tax=Petroclostridium xylanilyticum TaxID=1792311 RepID=UPI000B98D9C1|nr:ABC transporter substrate-binding protein [Petroclostridium xylanilyticum]